MPALDYYYIGQGDEATWASMLGMVPGGRQVIPGEISSHICSRAYERTARRIRCGFRGLPNSSGVQRGYARVAALATHCKDVSKARGTWLCEVGQRHRLASFLQSQGVVPSRAENRGRSSDGFCSLLPLRAALRVASMLSIPVVEIVGGLRIRHGTGDRSEASGGGYGWADLLEGDPSARYRPENILVDNLVQLATSILTELPPRELSPAGWLAPPVTLALEIEPGASHILNSLTAYRRVRNRYRERVKGILRALRKEDPEGERVREHYQAFRGYERLTRQDWRRLTVLYELCVGLNVDIGHMLLNGEIPGNVSCFTWERGSLAVRGADVDDVCRPLALDGNLAEEISAYTIGDLTKDVVHYHCSDHCGAHFCDQAPGMHHAAEDFKLWIRQAYALAQLSGVAPGSADVRPLIHPNLSRHIAIELESTVLGVDQVVSSYALVDLWLRQCAFAGEAEEPQYG
ncbi:MAG: hypothetical protein JXR77_17150 [Lentisphaeria bacterium]|nr:hypothetical protein [Lentisphaeria bacterium]